MIRSMYSAISGLRAHQTMMDVIGNNISNVNTTGYKSSSVIFQDILGQATRGAGAAQVNDGGTNPSTIGLGSKVTAVTTSFAQGSFQSTGRATDFAIGGDGFFIASQDGARAYTRAGAFSIDALGRLVTQEGAFVQGWQADQFGEVVTNAPIGSITVPVGDLIEPVQSETIVAGGNLPANSAVGTTLSSAVNVYDAQGNPVQVRLEFEKTGADTWTAAARYVDGTGNLVPAPPAPGQSMTGGTLTFGLDGELTSSYDLTIAPGFLPGFATDAVTVNLGAAGESGRVNQFGQLATMAVQSQDGSGPGSLAGFSVSQEGLIVGTYSNGRTAAIGQVALASFANPEGLEKIGGTLFRETVNYGLSQIGVAGQGGRGLMQTGSLEMSNVDLGREFTNLIVAQRGFQANSRVVTTSDEMLQELVNMKR